MSLADAILYGTKADIERLLEAGAEVNDLDDYGYTPLIEAAITNKTDIAKLLLEHGAIVDDPDATGRTALHWAVANYNIPLCQLLLERKADANAYTIASEPVLVYPLLREQQDLKRMLYDHGADLNFALDYINTKLIGHRYQLSGQADIVNHQGEFIELDFEGFFLEFTLGIIQSSLQRYRYNFTARHLRSYFKQVEKVLKTLKIASELMRFQQYSIDLEANQNIIYSLIDNDPLIIPVCYQGHAVTFVKLGTFLARCDRGELSKKIGSSIIIYRVGKPAALTKHFIKNLMYKRQEKIFINQGIEDVLGLKPIMRLPLASQISGNCSWANVEASIPTLLFLLLLQERGYKDMNDVKEAQQMALTFYEDWHEWDKDFALYECLQSFVAGSPARKASKAAILGAILLQSCKVTNVKDVERAKKILDVLTTPGYTYVLRSYIQVYYKDAKTPEGENLMRLLAACKVKFN